MEIVEILTDLLDDEVLSNLVDQDAEAAVPTVLIFLKSLFASEGRTVCLLLKELALQKLPQPKTLCIEIWWHQECCSCDAGL